MSITLIHYQFQVHGGKGIGSKLIEAAEIYATEKGIKIALLVNLENKRAYSLYEKLGYKKMKLLC